MSDIPSPAPTSEPAKPKLSLAPKTAAPAPAPAPMAEEPAAPAPVKTSGSHTGVPTSPTGGLQSASTATPAALLAAASKNAGAAKPSLNLRGEVHPANGAKVEQFVPPIPAAASEGPGAAVVALSALSAAAAIAFAVLLFLKNQ